MYIIITNFVRLDILIAMSLTGNVHVWLGCSKMWSPKIGAVLDWQPPDVHIFGTDPSLISTIQIFSKNQFSTLHKVFLSFLQPKTNLKNCNFNYY